MPYPGSKVDARVGTNWSPPPGTVEKVPKPRVSKPLQPPLIILHLHRPKRLKVVEKTVKVEVGDLASEN